MFKKLTSEFKIQTAAAFPLNGWPLRINASTIYNGKDIAIKIRN